MMEGPRTNTERELAAAEAAESVLESSDVAVNPETGLAIVVIKPDAFAKREQIVARLKGSGLYVVKSVTKQLPENFVIGAMYTELPKGIEEQTIRHFNSGPAEIILLEGGQDLLKKVVSVTGEKTNPNHCDEDSIRRLFGEHFGRDAGDGLSYYRNAIHRGKDTGEQAADLKKFEHWL